MMRKHYKYIIAGAGCSGLMLAYYLNRSLLKNNKILIIDNCRKESNNKIWSFWEKGENDFEQLVKHYWKKIEIKHSGKELIIPTKDYRYKTIKSDDYYKYIYSILIQNQAFDFKVEKIISIDDQRNKALVFTENTCYSSDYVFSSIDFNSYNSKKINNKNLNIQFYGVKVKCNISVFKKDIVTLMDLRNDTKKNETHFGYILPFNDRTALIEYTIFATTDYNNVEIKKLLLDYIKNKKNIKDYRIIASEKGSISLQNIQNSNSKKRIINIGACSGMVKLSTGYAFKRIQNQCKQIVKSLEKNTIPSTKTYWLNRFKIYDNALIYVLNNTSLNNGQIFYNLFKRNKIKKIFKFLDEKTTLIEESRIFLTMRISIFVIAMMKAIRKSIVRNISN